MTQSELALLENQLNTLDQDTARRVTRLVFECSASLDLALMAVQEADRARSGQSRQPGHRRPGAGILAALRAR
jgi:hypothetical protein